jgi:hypothetical protein
MATTSNTYTGDGTNKLFLISFSVGSNGLPYLELSDVDVYLNGTLKTLTTDYTFANATTIEFVTAPAVDAVVLLKRSTNDATKAATFFPGSSIKAADLNTNFDQVLYIAQETANDAANQSTAGLQAQITAATNTANNAATSAGAAATSAATSASIAASAVTTSLQKAGDTITGNIDNTATGYFDLPVGTTGQRPGSPNTGMIRFNSDLSAYEGYNSSGWLPIGGGARGGGTDDVFYENSAIISTSYTITAGKNAVTAGPVTVQTGATVVVPSGSSWTIV